MNWVEVWYRPLNGALQAALSLIGMLVVLTPLALWVAWNETIYFGTLATAVIGAGLFCLFAWLLHHLHLVVPDELEVDPETAHGAYVVHLRSGRLADWEHLQEDDPGVQANRGEYRDTIVRNLRLVFVSAGITMLLGSALLIGAWALIVSRYGGV